MRHISPLLRLRDIYVVEVAPGRHAGPVAPSASPQSPAPCTRPTIIVFHTNHHRPHPSHGPSARGPRSSSLRPTHARKHALSERRAQRTPNGVRSSPSKCPTVPNRFATRSVRDGALIDFWWACTASRRLPGRPRSWSTRWPHRADALRLAGPTIRAHRRPSLGPARRDSSVLACPSAPSHARIA